MVSVEGIGLRVTESGCLDSGFRFLGCGIYDFRFRGQSSRLRV